VNGYEKRDLNREVPLDSPIIDPETDLVAREPPADSASLADEAFQRLLQGRPLVQQRILSLRREGQSYAAIAMATELHESSVRRILGQFAQESPSDRHQPASVA